jgi:hypothetical protein
VRAAVGDQVVVKMGVPALIRNVGVLIGIPILALGLGWVLSVLTPDAELSGAPLEFLWVFLSLPGGIAGGIILYRRLSRNDLPVVSRIIRTRAEMASDSAVAREPMSEFAPLYHEMHQS